MSQQSVVTLNTHAYNPRGVSGGIASWVDSSNSNGSGVNRLTESVRGPNGSGITRVRFQLSLPLLATADTACACAGSVLGTASASVDVLIPGSFQVADRENLQKQITDLAASTEFIDAVKNLTGAW